MNRLFGKYVNALALAFTFVGGAFAAETLFSNAALNVSETGKTGSLWVFSRGDIYSGVTLLELKVGANGVQVVESRQDQMTDSVTATQNGIFRDVLAEHRRTPSVYAGKIGYVLPMFGLDDDGEYLQPTGIFRVGGIDNIYETPLEQPEALADLDTAMYYAVSGFAYDSSKKQLWMARGAAGLGLYDASGSKVKHGMYQLNLKAVTLDSAGIRAWDMDEDGKSEWLYGYATGAIDRDFRITSICSFPLAKNVTGLALATYGNGISVSADTGKTWTPILNRAKLGNDLGSVRMVPSVITAGDQALVSYKVGKDSKITIDVFSYDMRKIRTIVKSAPRGADASRSTNPKEDFWDGKDKAGRPCTMGVYYVRVKDNHGHIGWGKVMTLGGHK